MQFGKDQVCTRLSKYQKKKFSDPFFFKTGLKITVIKTDLYFQYVRLLTIKSSA